MTLEYFRGRGLKFQYCKILEGRNQGITFDTGEEGTKDGQKNSDVVYGRPLK